jgi:hypothetical protein
LRGQLSAKESGVKRKKLVAAVYCQTRAFHNFNQGQLCHFDLENAVLLKAVHLVDYAWDSSMRGISVCLLQVFASIGGVLFCSSEKGDRVSKLLKGSLASFFSGGILRSGCKEQCEQVPCR